MDLGIYCVQGACYTTGEVPVAVTAEFGEVTRPKFFDDVEQSITWQMEFPGGAVADCSSSYNQDENLLRADAADGWWQLQPAYSYSGIARRNQRRADGLPAGEPASPTDGRLRRVHSAK